MILSRTFRLEDYKQLKPQLSVLNEITDLLGWNVEQHLHRRWEWALALKVIDEIRVQNQPLKIADFGGGVGFLGPACLLRNDKVALYEVWNQPSDRQKATHQFCEVKDKDWELINRGLGELDESDFCKYDVACCISVLEHTENPLRCFEDLLRSVRPGGLVFLTVDFALDENDHYVMNHLRKRIYTEQKMWELVEKAREFDFLFLHGEADWSWQGQQVYDYNFASLALRAL